METPKGKNYGQFYLDGYTIALEEKKYEAALDYAMKGYFVSKDIGDDVFNRMFLYLLRTVVNNLIDKTLDKRSQETKQGYCCSFCGRKSDEVQLMAGALGSICQDCANRVHEYFTQGK